MLNSHWLDNPSRLPLANSRKVAIIAVFSALALAVNYALTPFPNIKLFDTLVFVSALLFGLDTGIAIAALTWLVYGSVNPYGADPLNLLFTLMISETVYAFFGWIARKTSSVQNYKTSQKSLLFGFMGLVGAIIYDIATIVGPLMIIGVSATTSFLSLANPATVYFMLSHELSDFVFFSTVAPLLMVAISRIVPSWTVLAKMEAVITK